MKMGRQPVLRQLVVDTSNPSPCRKDRNAHVAHVAQERSLLAQRMEQAAHITSCCTPAATFSLDTVQSISVSPVHPAKQPGSNSPLAVLHQYQQSPHHARPPLLAPQCGRASCGMTWATVLPVWLSPGQYRLRPQSAGHSCALRHLCLTTFGLRVAGMPPPMEVIPALAPWCCHSTPLVCTPPDPYRRSPRSPPGSRCHRFRRWPRPPLDGCRAFTPFASPGCQQTSAVRLPSTRPSQPELCPPSRCSRRRCPRRLLLLRLCHICRSPFRTSAQTPSSSLRLHSFGALRRLAARPLRPRLSALPHPTIPAPAAAVPDPPSGGPRPRLSSPRPPLPRWPSPSPGSVPITA